MRRSQPGPGASDETCGLLEIIPLSPLEVGTLSLQTSQNSRKRYKLVQALFIYRAFTED